MGNTQNSRSYARTVNESTQVWLERLIGMGAPSDVRADVRALLEAERQPVGKLNDL
jgi:hypothetical protein